MIKRFSIDTPQFINNKTLNINPHISRSHTLTLVLQLCPGSFARYKSMIDTLQASCQSPSLYVEFFGRGTVCIVTVIYIFLFLFDWCRCRMIKVRQGHKQIKSKNSHNKHSIINFTTFKPFKQFKKCNCISSFYSPFILVSVSVSQ